MSLSATVLVLLLTSPASTQIGAETRHVNRIGFQQFQNASRVVLRTNETVRYDVQRVRPDVVRVTLLNSQVPRANDRRPLDTRHFDSPILWVEAQQTGAPDPTVWVDIHLRDSVTEFTTSQRGTRITLDFPRRSAHTP